MRGVSRWASRVAPPLALFLLGAASAWANGLPTDPPQARVNPPIGMATQARVNPPIGVAPLPAEGTTQARIEPPVGGQARIQPPVGAPMTLGDMILLWLQSQLSIPNG